MRAEIERAKTLKDLKEKLDACGKCCVPRCTGFGKTTMIANMVCDYNHVLYLYPTEVIRDTVEKVIENKYMFEAEDGVIEYGDKVEFMTYQKLAISKSFEGYEDVDLIVLDECHRIGAEKTAEKLHMLIDYCKNAKLVGLTATPERSDDFDVVQEFFDGICVYRYTLADAIRDGIVQKPYYCFCSYDFESDLKESALITEEKLSDKDCEYILKSHCIEIARIHNMDNNIKSVCDKYALSTDYMKFIVFYPDIKTIDEKKEDIRSWFKLAYPDHIIHMVELSSRDKETRDTEVLEKCHYREKTIDLINCVDMLNMGYHISDITGIVMMRGTHSGIIYSQQLGRAISSGDSHGKIVFDVVDNIHRKSYYEVLQSESISQIYKKIEKLRGDLLRMTLNHEGEIAIAKKKNEILSLERKIEVLTSGNSKLKELLNALKTKPYYYINELAPEDLIAVGNIATERELIAKCVAEVVSSRCRKAFAKWINAKAIREKKYVNVSSKRELRKFIEENNITEESILEIEESFSKGATVKDIPLSPFCKIENVSINAVLDLMFKNGYDELDYSEEEREVV